MKTSFPHMGNLAIALSGALRSLGGEVVVPPYSSKKTLDIGTKHSPEAICLPYKLVLGNYIEAVEAGAEALIMINSPGTCRLGQYSDLARIVLTDLGYDVKFINVDLYKGKLPEAYNCFKTATGNGNPLDIINAIRIAILKFKATDKFDAVLNYCIARELKFGTSEKRYNKALALIDEALTVKECNEAIEFGVNYISSVPIDTEKQVLNVYTTGEIYVVTDRFSNMETERELGRMGVHVHRRLNISDWIDASLYPSLLRFSETYGEKTQRYANEFIKRDIGGDAIESVGDASIASDMDIDGIVHLSPFTCMPEIIAQNILPNVRNKKDIPVLSLIMDENTGRAGFVTRLEAYVDLLQRRRKTKQLLIV